MTDTEFPVRRAQVADPIDLRETLNALGVEFLEVTDERAIVISRGSVLNVTILEGTLSAATTIEVELFDPPKVHNDDLEPIVEKFINDVRSAAGSGSP